MTLRWPRAGSSDPASTPPYLTRARRRRDTRFGRSRARFPLVPALALLLGALSLLGAASAAAQATAPSAPRDVSVTADDGQLTLSWTAPASWGDYPALGYDIRWKLSGASSWNPVFLGGSLHDTAATATSFVFSGSQRDFATVSTVTVTNGTSYDLRIKARSQQGSDTLSSGWVTVTGTPTVTNDATLSGLTASTSASATGTFSALTLTPSTFSASTLSYTASVAKTVTHLKLTPTVTAAGATVQVGKQGTTLATVASGSASGALALVVGANAVTVEVTAADETTKKTYTVTVTRQPALPAALANFRLTRGVARLDASWNTPPRDDAVTGYDVHYTRATSTVVNTAAASGNDPSAAWVDAGHSGTGPRVTLSPLAIATWRVRARAVNGTGDGPWKFGSAKPRTTVKFATASQTVDEDVGDVEIAIVAGHASTFAGALKYTRRAQLDDPPATYAFTATTTSLTVSVDDDDRNESDTAVTVSLVGNADLVPVNPSSLTLTIRDNDLAPAPINLMATGGKNKFTATWTKRTNAGPVTAFQFRYRWQSAPDRAATTDNDPSTGWVTVDDSGGTPSKVNGIPTYSQTVEGLGHNESFYLQVRATDGTEVRGFPIYGPWSDRGTVTTDESPASGSANPQPPGNVSARSDNDGELTVSWAVEPGQACYDVRYRKAGGAWSTPANVCKLAWTGSSLDPGDYTAQVRTVYPGGAASAWSGAVGAIVKGGAVVSFGPSTIYNFTNSGPFCANAYCVTEGFLDDLNISLSKALTATTTVTLAAVPGSCRRLPCDRLYRNLPLTIDLHPGTTATSTPFATDDPGGGFIVDDVIADTNLKGSFDIRLEKIPGAAYSVDPGARATVHILAGDVATVSFQRHYRVSEGIPATIDLIVDKDHTYPITLNITTGADRICSDLHDGYVNSGFNENCGPEVPNAPLRGNLKPNPRQSPADTPDATPGVDYSPASQRVVIPPGTRTGRIHIQSLRDTVAEGDEFLLVFMDHYGDPLGRIEIGPDPTTVTITNTFQPTLSTASTSVVEGQSFTVNVDYAHTMAQTITLPLHTARRSAEAGDYSAPTTHTFAHGASSGSFTVTTAEDADADDDVFDVWIAAEGGLRSNNLRLTIKDNDVLWSNWAADLTVKAGASASRLGCANNVDGSKCSSTSVLTNDEFTHEGTSYSVKVVRLAGTNTPQLQFTLDKTIPAALRSSATLHVGSRQFAFSAGAYVTDFGVQGSQVIWQNTGLSWTVDQQVSLRLTGPPPQCPAGASGSPPNCVCPEGRSYDQSANSCVAGQTVVPPTQQCPAEAVSGAPPNCVCPQGRSYDQNTNACVTAQPPPQQCPAGASGSPPNCACPQGRSYDQNTNACVTAQPPQQCPAGASGSPPNCVCPQGRSYDQGANACVTAAPPPPQCPAGASGSPPNCVCPQGRSYDRNTNQCVADQTVEPPPQQCPADAVSGAPPNCVCPQGRSYDRNANRCVAGQTVEPPPSGGGRGGTTAVARIEDADPVVEGAPARFRIALDEAAGQRIDLLASTTAGTAAEGADYQGLSRHPVTLSAGESEVWLEVATLRDAQAEDDETFTVTLSSTSTATRFVRPEAQGTILDGPPPGAAVPLFPAGGRASRHGFLRVLDLGGAGGPVSIAATDDGGVAGTDSTLRLVPGGAAHFKSSDLETGNAAKGLTPGTGTPTRGDWRLWLTDADVGALAYARAHDGFVTPLVGTAPADPDGDLLVAFFNPGSNHRQVSLLRLSNPGEEAAEVTVSGTDDAGVAGAAPVRLTLPGGTARVLSARELENGAAGFAGALGDGTGKWRLAVASDHPVAAMSLLESPTGHLTNLSAATAPRTVLEDGTARTRVPLFPAANDPEGRQGFVRVVNRGTAEAAVSIDARDDAGTAYPALTLTLGARQAVHFNSDDLELGAPDKGLPVGTGTGTGGWRLALTAPEDVVALAYLRHRRDGFVTGMNALAPLVDGGHRVDFVNPASNLRQVGLLRLINAGAEPAKITVTATDDAGDAGAAPVSLTLAPHAVRTLTSAELESGGEGLEGELGDGTGKWRLRIVADQPIRVMSLLASPTGHLANLSAAVEP